MKTHVRSSFTRDLRRIADSKTVMRIEQVVEKIETAERLRDVPNIEKVLGGQNGFRVRVGDYRIGLYFIASVEKTYTARFLRDIRTRARAGSPCHEPTPPRHRGDATG